MPKPPGQSTFRLRIQLNDFDPVIWRRIVSPGAIHMDKFANVLLAAMGWSNSHLHAFTVGDERYGKNYDDFPEGEVDEKTVTILQALQDQRRFTFAYDFGDWWDARGRYRGADEAAHRPQIRRLHRWRECMPAGRRRRHRGYADFLDAIADPAHDEHASFLQWVGGSFDPSAFDLAEVNARLQKVR